MFIRNAICLSSYCHCRKTVLHWSPLFSVSFNGFLTTYSFILKQSPPMPHINFYISQLAAHKATPELQWLTANTVLATLHVWKSSQLWLLRLCSTCLHIQRPRLKGHPQRMTYAFLWQKGRARGIKSHLRTQLESGIVTSHISLTKLSMMEWEVFSCYWKEGRVNTFK